MVLVGFVPTKPKSYGDAQLGEADKDCEAPSALRRGSSSNLQCKRARSLLSPLQCHPFLPLKDKPAAKCIDLTLLTPTLTADTDSEEDDESLKDEWPSQSPSSSKMRPPNLYSVVAKKSSKPAGGLKPAKRGMAATRTLKSKPAASRKQQFCLLLREAEAGSSFSDSSEDSFDQGY